MEIITILTERLKDAMRNKNASELKTLRLIKAELTKAEKDGITLNDVTTFKILNKMIAQRKDSYEQYVNAKRLDLAEIEKEEMNVIESFMPKMPSEEEMKGEVVKTINTYLKEQGEDFKLTMKDMKTILNRVQQTIPTINGKLVADVIKTYL